MTEPSSAGNDQPQDASHDPAMPPPPPPYSQQVTGYNAGPGPVGQIRGTGKCVLLTIVTLGIYAYFWYYGVHKEMQQYRNGQGLGGGLALVLAFFVGFVMPFLTAGEVGGLYEAHGQAKPVSGVTGCWIFLPFVGGIVWFVKTNGALNSFWQSVGVTA